MVKSFTNTEKILSSIIAVLILVIVVYFGSLAFNNAVDNKVLESRNQVVENMVLTMLQQTNNCSTSSLMYGNFSRSLIDLQCAVQERNNVYAQMYIATQNCSIATLNIGNYTREVIDVACLGQQ